MNRIFRPLQYCIRFGEIPVMDVVSEKKYTLTQPKRIITANDYETVTRFVAVDDHCPVDGVPEKDFYVYRLSWMEPGPVLVCKYVSQEIMDRIMEKHYSEITKGKYCFKKFFDNL